MDSYLNCPPFLDSSFTDIANTTSTPLGWIAMKWQAKAMSTLKAASQMASIGAIFTFTYHKNQLNPQLNSSASHVVNNSQSSACQWKVEPFKDHLSICGCLTSLRNKPQEKQPKQCLAPIPG